MATQYDPRLQKKPNTTDILTGQEDLSQDAQTPPESPSEPLQNTQATQAASQQQNTPQSNLATNKPKSSSGMFTNVQNYMQKNQPAAQEMAKSIGGTVQKSADIARKNIQSTQNKFTNLMDQGSLQNRESAIKDLQSRVNAAATMQAPQQSIQPTEDQQSIQPTEDMANQATGGLRTFNSQIQYMPTGKVPDGFNQDTMSQQTIMEGAEERFKNYEDSSRENLLDFWKNAKPGDERIVPIRDEWGRFTGTKVETITQEQIDNMLSGPKLLGSTMTGDITDPTQTQVTSTQPEMSESDRRIKSILDAAYKGPQRLEELGSFGDVQSKAQEAERLRQQLSGSNQNKQELMRKALEKRNSQYSEGAKRLDELLLTGDKPQEYLQQLQTDIGDVGQDLATASQSARQGAIERAGELSDIRSQARDYLQSKSTQRLSDVEREIERQMGIGTDLADYFTELIGKQDSGLDLGSLEAQTLGIQSGTGMYNLLKDPEQREALLSGLNASDRLEAEKMITRNEQAQLAELERLARLSSDYGVADSGLNFKNRFTNADLAGSQSALDALDLGDFRERLIGAEQDFRDSADKTIKGIGEGKAKYWNASGTNKRYAKQRTTATANLKDALAKSGYDFDSDINTGYTSEEDTRNFLENLTNQANQARLNSRSQNNTVLDHAQDAAEFATGIGAISPTLDFINDYGFGTVDNIGKEISGIGGDIGKIAGGAISGLSDLGSDLVSGLSGIFGGGRKEAAKKKAKKKANEAAIKDLKAKFNNAINQSGFQNRANVQDTDESLARQNQFLNLLSRIRNQ